MWLKNEGEGLRALLKGGGNSSECCIGSPSFPHGPVTVPCSKVDGSRQLYLLVRPPGNDGAEG